MFVGGVWLDTDSFVTTEVVGRQRTAVHAVGIETDDVWTNDWVPKDSMTRKDPSDPSYLSNQNGRVYHPRERAI